MNELNSKDIFYPDSFEANVELRMIDPFPDDGLFDPIVSDLAKFDVLAVRQMRCLTNPDRGRRIVFTWILRDSDGNLQVARSSKNPDYSPNTYCDYTTISYMGMDKQGTAAENHRRRKSYVLPQDHIDGINYISEFAINPKVNDLDKSFVNILVDIDPLSDTPWDDSIYEEYGPRPLEG